MDFTESGEILALRETVRRFISRECPPTLVREWDQNDAIPRELSLKFGELGFCGFCVPEEYGGMGRQVIAMTTVQEELARCCMGLVILYQMSASYGALNVSEFGTDEQKRRLLPGLLSGKILFSYGLSEADVGGDLANVKTRAERRADTVIVNGAKRWTTGAAMSDYIYALVRTGPADAPRKNLSFLIIPSDAKGVSITRIPVMGARGIPTHDVTFENVEIPFENVMWGEAGWNNGWAMLAGPALEIEKLSPCTIALGTAEAAVAEAWEYSQQRVQGGKHICGHQAVRHVLADAQTKLQACRLMSRYAASMVQSGQPSATATSMAKLFISETAKEIVLSCQQYVMGAYGYAAGFNMERYVRDILLVPIAGGSSAIQKNNIANLMGLPRN